MEGLYYLCSESKGVDQLLRNGKADLCICFRICQKSVSHDAAQLMSDNLRVRGCLSLSRREDIICFINVESQARYM